jgi:hypothetical protein
MTLIYEIFKKSYNYFPIAKIKPKSFTIVYNKLLVVDMMLYLRLITNKLGIVLPRELELYIKEYLIPFIPNLNMEPHKEYIHLISSPVYDLELLKINKDGYKFRYGKHTCQLNDYIYFNLIENNILFFKRYDFLFFIKDYDFVFNKMKKFKQFKNYYNSIRSETNLILSVTDDEMIIIWELWIKYFKRFFLIR